MSTKLIRPNVVVIGGSYVGIKLIDVLAPSIHQTHNTVLIEKSSHFQHLFAFPRISVVPGFEHKAFIPYANAFNKTPEGSTSVINATATQVQSNQVLLDTGGTVPFEYLVLATGIGPPGPLLHARDKSAGTKFFQEHQKEVERASNIAVIGGGAYGVQLAFDLKEHYPSKTVTLIHSREQLMNRFHPKLHSIVLSKLKAADIKTILGKRVSIPATGFPSGGESEFDIPLSDGTSTTSDLAVICTGQTALPSPLLELSPASFAPHSTSQIRVKPTMQVIDDAFPNIFAIGDVADTAAAKAARPGHAQAQVVTANIRKLISEKQLGAEKPREELEAYTPTPPAIHLSLGLTHAVKFRNPPSEDEEPWFEFDDNGKLDVGCEGRWAERAPGVEDYWR